MATVEAFNELRDELQAHAAELSQESGRRGFAEGVNAAFLVIQHHVGIERAVAIGNDLLALLNNPEELPGEVTDPAETSGPNEQEAIDARRRSDWLGTGSRTPAA